jgi:mRNA interferase MazF
MARGDIVIVDFPQLGGAGGREQIGNRPAAIVQADAPVASGSTIMVVPCTTKLSALQFLYTIRIDPSPRNGLNQPSVLLVFQPRAIDRRRVGNKIGRLEPHHMGQLETEMRTLLGL